VDLEASEPLPLVAMPNRGDYAVALRRFGMRQGTVRVEVYGLVEPAKRIVGCFPGHGTGHRCAAHIAIVGIEVDPVACAWRVLSRPPQAFARRRALEHDEWIVRRIDWYRGVHRSIAGVPVSDFAARRSFREQGEG